MRATIEHIVVKRTETVGFVDSTVPIEGCRGVEFEQLATIISVRGRVFQQYWDRGVGEVTTDMETLDDVTIAFE